MLMAFVVLSFGIAFVSADGGACTKDFDCRVSCGACVTTYPCSCPEFHCVNEVCTENMSARYNYCTKDSDCKLIIAGCSVCGSCKDSYLNDTDVIPINKNNFKCPPKEEDRNCLACSGALHYNPNTDAICINNQCEKINKTLPGEDKMKNLPAVASERARERLGELGFNVTNVSVKTYQFQNQLKYAYDVVAEKDARILGLFKVKARVSAEVDAETGNVTSMQKPWWAFIASGI